MNALEIAIAAALKNTGEMQAANKAYLEFIKANFFIPIEKDLKDNEPIVLFLEDKEQVFLPVFTNIDYFNTWATPICDNIQQLNLSGVDLLKGVGENVTVSLNIGSPIYKSFLPAELARMRSMILKLFA